MGNGYKFSQQFQYQQSLNHIQKATFLPMLCSRTSIKDVALQQPRPLQENSSSSSSSSSTNDPLSPKIGCMGQVKRNNKIIGFPTASSCRIGSSKLASTAAVAAAATTKARINNDDKYFKLKRFFSAKNIDSNTGNAICTGSSCRRRRIREMNTNTVGVSVSASNRRRAVNGNQDREACSINIAEMDPPLPVIKRVPKPADCEGEENKNSIWKRRSNGGALKVLELQHIQIPRHQVEIQTV